MMNAGKSKDERAAPKYLGQEWFKGECMNASPYKHQAAIFYTLHSTLYTIYT